MKRQFVLAGLAAGLVACDKDVAERCPGQCHGSETTVLFAENSAIDVELLLIVDPALVAAQEGRFREMVRAFTAYPLDLSLGMMPIGAPGERWLVGGEACGLAGAELVQAPRTCGLAPNFGGALEEIAACLARSGASMPAPGEALETMRRALMAPRAPASAWAGLWVVVVAGRDDASAAPVADYVQLLSAVHRERRQGVLLSIVAPPAAPRFEQLVDGFPESILARTDSDWTRVTGAYRRSYHPGSRCLPEVLVDTAPAEPGIQPECVVSEHLDEAGAAGPAKVIPRCGSGVVPCHELRTAAYCPSSLELVVQRGGCLAQGNTFLKLTCAVVR